jgi:uncharacterized membrane protein YhaH (DUF805 family)
LNNPYNAPGADLSALNNAEPYQPRVWAVNGRIGRVRYIAYSTLMSMAIIFGSFLLAGIVASMAPGNPILMVVVFLLVFFPIMAVAFIMAIRRVNDMGHSGWMSLIILVPIASLWLLFAPGTAGANQYGPPPVKNSTGVIIAAFSPLLFVFIMGILAAIAIPAYQGYVMKAKAAAEQNAAPVIVDPAAQ